MNTCPHGADVESGEYCLECSRTDYGVSENAPTEPPAEEAEEPPIR